MIWRVLIIPNTLVEDAPITEFKTIIVMKVILREESTVLAAVSMAAEGTKVLEGYPHTRSVRRGYP
jgi:hypothetical protein